MGYSTGTNKVVVRVRFKLPKNGVRNDRVVVTYPAEVTIAGVEGDFVVYTNGVVVAAAALTFVGGNALQFTPFSGTELLPDVEVAMTINWPRTVVSTSNFKIESFRKVGSVFSKM